MHHGTCVTHVPWCMSGSLTCGDGENIPGIPGACAPAISRIWQEAHARIVHAEENVPLTHWRLSVIWLSNHHKLPFMPYRDTFFNIRSWLMQLKHFCTSRKQNMVNLPSLIILYQSSMTQCKHVDICRKLDLSVLYLWLYLYKLEQLGQFPISWKNVSDRFNLMITRGVSQQTHNVINT